MISRILAIVTLLFAALGGAYYFLRSTPQKEIVRLREEVREYLERNEKLELAEQLTDQVLKLIPNSAYDLVTKATIRERRGSPEDLKEALRIYDQLLGGSDPNVLSVAFLKARVCRHLGYVSEATGTLLSVIDLFPVEALLELGETSLAGLSAGEALKFYSKAKEIAATRLEQTRAEEGIANCLLLLLSLNSGPSLLQVGNMPAGTPEEQKAFRATLSSDARKSLQEALGFVKSSDVPSSTDEANRRLAWATLIVEKLASVRAPGDTPYTDGILLLEGRRKDYGLSNREQPLLLVRLGMLRLFALRDEKPSDPGACAELEQGAERDFIQALKASPAQARELLSSLAAKIGDGTVSPPGPEPVKGGKPITEANEYIQTLLAITRGYLGTSQFKRVLEDRSELALSQRIADVMDCGHSGVAGLFKLLQGWARWMDGNAVEGERLVDDYLGGLAADIRPRGVVDVAEQAVALFPREPVCFKLLDKFEASGGKAFDFVGRRAALLLSARSKAPLAEEADRRLKDFLRRTGETAQTESEYLGASRVIYSLSGLQAAAELMSQAAARFPTDPTVQRAHADLEFERGTVASLDKNEREKSLREALAAYVFLFVRSPGDSQEVIRRCVETLHKLEDDRGDSSLDRALRRLFPSAPDRAFEPIVASVRMFLLGQFAPALEKAASIQAAEAEQFRPFLSFLKGNCHVGLATYLQKSISAATSDRARQTLQGQHKSHLQSAMDEFRREEDSVACRLELANLEFQKLGPTEDVPDDLLKRIQAISDSQGHDHAGYYLLARACHHRSTYRYRQKSVKNSEILRWVTREQKALRAAIRKSPTFNPAYLALAETFLITDRADRAVGESNSRQLFTPSYEKAINVLKAAPAPDDTIFSKLAQCYELSGKSDQAMGYLERIAALRPSVEVFSRLLSAYIRAENPAWRILLEPEPSKEAEAALPANLKERLPFLLSLRKSFESLPEHEGLRHMFLAMKEERSLNEVATAAAKKKAREVMIVEYMKALEAFEQKNLGVPMVVLNNLAWYLAEEPAPEQKARAVDLADRARKLTPSIAAAPDAHDTCAWVLHMCNMHSEAETVLREVLKFADQPSYRYHLAKVLFAMKKFDDALNEVQVARDSSRPFREEEAARNLEYEIREARRKLVGE